MNSYSKGISFLVLFSLFSVGVLCLWSTASMGMDSPSGHCAADGSNMALCDAGHVSMWQYVSNVIPQKTFYAFVLVLMMAFVSVAYARVWPRAPGVVSGLATHAYAVLRIIDPIERALARGILHTRIFPSLVG